MRDPPPPRIPPPKIPAPAQFSAEGDYLKPDKLKRWLLAVERYLSRHHMIEANTPDIVDWYSGPTEGSAEGACLIFMKHREQPPTLEEFIPKFKQLFKSSTNTDDLYRKWQKVHQNSGGKPGRITKVVGDLEDIKAALPDGAIIEYAYQQRFLDAMDTKLCWNVEQQIRPTDTMNDIIALAERFDATMYNTGAYKSTGGSSSSSSKPHKPKNTSTYRKPAAVKSEYKGKAPAKKKTYTKNKKPSKAEMDRRKAKRAGFYCGESGHMPNECPKKEVKTNHVHPSEDTENEESEAESVSTEELNEDASVLSFKTTVGTPLQTQPFKALKFTILINGKSARVLADIGTIGGTLIGNKFVTTSNIPYTAKKKPVVLTMAVKGSRSTSNYGCNVEIQIGRIRIPNMNMMVTPVSDYDVLISMDDATRFGAETNCRKSTIYFPDHKVRIYCNGKSTHPRAPMAKPQEKPDFPSLFPEVFVKEIPEELPPLCHI